MRETRDLPLVVDLDGTLTTTDTLAESVIRAVRRKPASLLRFPFWLASGRSTFKARIAEQADLRVEHLPYREPLVEYLEQEQQRGRKIVLATAAHRSIAERVGEHLDLFDEVIATDGETNLKGEAKLESIRKHVGERFVYAGDSKADLPVWAAAQGAILAGAAPAVTATIRDTVRVEREFSNECVNVATWCKALRVHQWLKNLLLFVPLLTAFAFFDADKIGTLVLAFFALSLGASATYIANDLWDLDNDRRHPRKRNRPFAKGTLSIAQGIGGGAVLLTLAFALACAVSAQFAAMFVLYLTLTTAYSWRLKSIVLLDVALSKRFGWLAAQLAICFATRHFIMSGYTNNAGDFVAFQLWGNLKFWVNPASYLSFYNLVGKGIFTPSLENPLMLVPLAVFFRAAWRNTPARYRRYFLAAFVPVVPLFLLFGCRDEARNFSVVFPAIILIALHGATRFDAIFGGRAAADHGGATRTPRVSGFAEVRETA
ncbi:UbiA family prenyltransferase [Burkholderia ubonensis]|uniref:UbiA family prenyltransferase n=1 Tax=Burkholderia ubonensis TaxID=101571 RepID=UPI0009B494E1|nr:UbiA family prenyltransferase [Burkholderia ubonensis]